MFHSDKSITERLRLFHNELTADAYEFLGPHKLGEGCIFRVWAPNAKEISLVGDFNGWDQNAHKMFKVTHGIWEVKVEKVNNFDAYKYAITDFYCNTVLKSDPYARHYETAPGNASKLYFDDDYKWADKKWQKDMANKDIYSVPINIYEVHCESWRKYADGSNFDYVKLAEELSAYVKDMGYTHVEFMPLTEYPFSGSWGYQVTGYFAPTSRYGTPSDFKKMVDIFHSAGIGVILDWVPAHFPRDEHGLFRFDGTHCYEYEDERRGEHKEWGTCVFNYGRVEVMNFLLSSACMFLKEFHIDGLRVDAVASMLYLDYGRNDGEWAQNQYGGNEHIEAIEFLRRLNEACFKANPKVMMIAEESTAWPMVTKPADWGGLGFNFKWNMGWMNDTLRYQSLDPIYRKFEHNLITFSFMYAFSENFILPISHDEVVHGKCSLINKMPGEYDQMFDNFRAYMTYIMMHPGKKLLFMGSEFAQFIEWDYKKELDWSLLSFDKHRQTQEFVKKLNNFYLENPALYEYDFDGRGFEWISGEDYSQSIICFRRKAKDGEELAVVCNFAPVTREGYRIGVPEAGTYKTVFCSDWKEFGGATERARRGVKTDKVGMHGQANSLELTIPGMSVTVFKRYKRISK
ncbi:MAG: 1,4-alpha-glucan branching protein GlgB [Clostridia bacterium]|nr:1,4-alpha-glucan branching protein GlgB [Clostridia bacterium]